MTIIRNNKPCGATAASVFHLPEFTRANDAQSVSSAISDARTEEDSAYSLHISGNFADSDVGDSLSFTASGLPSTLSMSSAGTISGTPVNADVGVHSIIVTATDDSSAAGTVTDTFVLTVTNTNDVQTLSSPIADASTDEDAAYSLDVSGNFADVDATDTLSYAATGMPTTLLKIGRAHV